MKKLALLGLFFCLCMRAYSCGTITEFAEISFYQDSVDPMTIHLHCKVRGPFCYTSTIIWGDGTQSDIPLTDTFSIAPCMSNGPMCEYDGSHTYNHAYADTTIYIGLYIDEINNLINNGAGSPITPIAAINFAALDSLRGFHGPSINGAYFATDTEKQILYYDPILQYDSSYAMVAQIIEPIVNYPNYTGVLFIPDEFPHAGPNNKISVDSSTGVLTWNVPPQWGFYMISLQFSLYRHGTFVCSITRDMMLQIVDTLTTGIPDIPNGNNLHCYPSPSLGTFTIDMTGINVGEKQINIYNQLGQVVYHTVSVLDKLQVNENLSSGIYTVAVTQGTRQYTRVVIE